MRARNTAGMGASATLTASVAVVVFGVVLTHGVYGSRLAWLFGVAMPLLALTMLLAWLSIGGSSRHRRTARHPSDERSERVGRGIFLVALSMFGLPCVAVLTLLGAYALIFVVYGLHLMV